LEVCSGTLEGREGPDCGALWVQSERKDGKL